jgi:hypothetical protein
MVGRADGLAVDHGLEHLQDLADSLALSGARTPASR